MRTRGRLVRLCVGLMTPLEFPPPIFCVEKGEGPLLGGERVEPGGHLGGAVKRGDGDNSNERRRCVPVIHADD